MDKAQTNRVGTLLTRAREEGTVPWAHPIVQEGRAIERIANVGQPGRLRPGRPGVVPAEQVGGPAEDGSSW